MLHMHARCRPAPNVHHMTAIITLADVQAAAGRIAERVLRSPAVPSHAVSLATGELPRDVLDTDLSNRRQS